MPSDVRVLEGLETVNFGLSFAKIVVAKSSTIEHPELDLGDSDDKAFKIKFVDGRLVVSNAPLTGGSTVIQFGNMTTTIGGYIGSMSFISGDDVVIDGSGITVDGVRAEDNSSAAIESRNVSVVTLKVPTSYCLNYDLQTAHGDIDFDVETADDVFLATSRGAIDLKVSDGGKITLDTSNGRVSVASSKLKSLLANNHRGEINVSGLNSSGHVSLNTHRADISVESSNAPSWSMNTHRGNISVSATTGTLDTYAFKGSVQVR